MTRMLEKKTCSMAFLFGLNMNSFKTKPAKLPAKTFANHSTKCMACGFFSSVKVSSLRPFMAEAKCGDRSMRTSRSKPHDPRGSMVDVDSRIPAEEKCKGNE